MQRRKALVILDVGVDALCLEQLLDKLYNRDTSAAACTQDQPVRFESHRTNGTLAIRVLAREIEAPLLDIVGCLCLVKEDSPRSWSKRVLRPLLSV